MREALDCLQDELEGKITRLKAAYENSLSRDDLAEASLLAFELAQIKLLAARASGDYQYLVRAGDFCATAQALKSKEVHSTLSDFDIAGLHQEIERLKSHFFASNDNSGVIAYYLDYKVKVQGVINACKFVAKKYESINDFHRAAYLHFLSANVLQRELGQIAHQEVIEVCEKILDPNYLTDKPSDIPVLQRAEALLANVKAIHPFVMFGAMLSQRRGPLGADEDIPLVVLHLISEISRGSQPVFHERQLASVSTNPSGHFSANSHSSGAHRPVNRQGEFVSHVTVTERSHYVHRHARGM